jgi:hypothetical protein
MIDCQIIKLEDYLYEVLFDLKNIERYFVEIYFDKEFVNNGRKISSFIFFFF